MRFTWTKRAVDRATHTGNFDPKYTISAPNIADVYDGFVRQLRTGTPWALCNDDGNAVDWGVA